MVVSLKRLLDLFILSVPLAICVVSAGNWGSKPKSYTGFRLQDEYVSTEGQLNRIEKEMLKTVRDKHIRPI